MKKSLLATAVLIALVGTSQAATVYDKDGTTLTIGGRIQSLVMNGNFSKYAGDRDSSLINSARFSIGGKTKINEWLSAYAFSEWDMADGNKAKIGDTIKAREQYVGVDFGKFGKLQGGKTFDVTKSILTMTDLWEDIGIQNIIGLNGDRRTGVIRYDLNLNGFFLSLNYQTASDDMKMFGNTVDVENGGGGALGYTIDDVWFGPLTFKAAYSFLKGQNDFVDRFDKAQHALAGVSWGRPNSGFYIAGIYNRYEIKNDLGYIGTIYKEQDYKAFEVTVAYNFDNGIGLYTGYNYWNSDLESAAVDPLLGRTHTKAIYRRVPVAVKYNFNANFKIWTEAEFDANSDVRYNSKLRTGTLFSAGARYTF